MEQYIQGTITILSLVNPLISGMMFSKAVSGQTRSVQINSATQAILTILFILSLAAIGGAYLLKTFNISLDAFQVAGGLVLGGMGLQMLRGNPSPTTGHSEIHDSVSLTPLILFASSPGTITGVITLSISHARSDVPITVLASIAAALLITWVMMLSITHSQATKKQGLFQDVSTRFMGLIVLAMGMQFALSGLKDFFAA